LTIDIRFTFRPIGTLWCQVGLIFICKEQLETGQEPLGLDQKTSSYLQYLFGRAFWGCEKGETLLLPGEERVRPHKLLLKGLGQCNNLNPSQLVEQVKASAETLANIEANDIGVRMPPIWGRESYAELLIDTSLTFARAWKAIETKGVRVGSELRLVYALDTMFLEEIEGAAAQLRNSFLKDPVLDASIVVESLGSRWSGMGIAGEASGLSESNYKLREV